MSNAHGLTKENLLFTFPAGLRENPSIAALGDVTMEALAKRPAEIAPLSIYPRIDELPEVLLDILAYDFKVDWWDRNYSIEEKRRTLKGSWYVHKHMGTKAAVETAIRAIYPLTTVEEWFEYEGGKPYHFRLRINITSDSGDRERQKRVLERLNFYKNLRSHVDEVRYFLMPEKSWAVVGGVYVGSREIDRAEIRVPPLKKPGGEVITIAGGGLIGSRSEGHVEIHVPRLQRPGGKTVVSAVGIFTGSYSRDHTAIIIPPLQRPGGKTVTIAGGLFTGSYSRDHAAIRVPPLQQTGGSAAVSPAGALRGMYRRIHTAVDVPELARPRAAANRATATGFIGSVERVTVTVKTSKVKVSTGRAATGGAAGMFHSYQRIRVSIGSPATIISGR
jgi:phage tail P2-like protein